MGLCFAVKNGGDRREPLRFSQKEGGRQPPILFVEEFKICVPTCKFAILKVLRLIRVAIAK